MSISLSQARRDLSSNDSILFGKTYRALKATGQTQSQLYRIALAGDPELTRDAFADRVALAEQGQ